MWARRDDLTPYGRALLLLTLDAGKDARGNELATSLLAEAKQTGDLAWWEVDHDPLLEDWADTSVEATATAVQALAARAAGTPVLEAAVRYLLANRQSGAYWVSTKQTAMALYGLTAFMKARGETAVGVCRRCLGQRRGGQDRDLRRRLADGARSGAGLGRRGARATTS